MNPPILTADKAGGWCKYLRREGYRDHALVELDAIATGRTVVVPVISEAQAREAFVQWWAGTDGTYVDCYLAALRHAGVLK